MVGSCHSVVVVTMVNRDLLGDLLRDLITDLPGHLDGNLNWDILAALLGDLLGHLVALLDGYALALLVVSIPIAFLLVGGLTRRLIDGVIVGAALLLVFGLVVGVINCVTLLFVDCLVDCLVGGLALLFAITTLRMRSSGAEAKEGKNDEDCRLHVVSWTRNSVVWAVEWLNDAGPHCQRPFYSKTKCRVRAGAHWASPHSRRKCIILCRRHLDALFAYAGGSKLVWLMPQSSSPAKCISRHNENLY